MPLTANKSETLTGTGAWMLIASEGSVVVTCAQHFSPAYCFTPDATAPSSAEAGHQFEGIGNAYARYDGDLTGDQYLWVLVPSGAPFAAMATDPA